MRKGFLMILAVALVAVLAAPAVAGTDINGFYRAKGYVSNFKTGLAVAPPITNDMQDAGYVEQRFRVRFAFGEENVKAVWFSEIDFSYWGDSAGSASPGGAARNVGGALGGDKINLETKNVYVWFKVPDTSLDFTVGLQNQTDSFFGLLYGGADMAGIFATGKYEPVSWKLGWAKLYENNTAYSDDFTLYMGSVNFAPSKESKLGFSVYYWQDDTQKYLLNTQATNAAGAPGTPLDQLPFATGAADLNTKKIWTVGIDGAYNAGSVALSGFFLYQFGTIDFLVPPNDSNVDVSAFAADLRVDANLGPGKLFVEGLVLSGGDNSGDNYQSVVTLSDANASPGGNSAFTRLDYSILMGNADDINTNQCLIGCAASAASQRTPTGFNSSQGQSPGNFGRGIWTIGAGYTMKVAEKTTMKIGGGYLAAVKTLQSDTTQFPNMSKDMGWEVNGNVNYNIMKGLDFGLFAAWAQIGDFFQGTTSTTNSPDSVYDLHFRLNYAF